MTLKYLLISILFISFLGCNNDHIILRKKVESPNKINSLKIIEKKISHDNIITQLIIKSRTISDSCKSCVFSAQGADLKIDALWLLENDLLVKYPSELIVIKKDTIFRNKCINVNIFYQEKEVPDSLIGRITRYERIAIMDTTLAILKGNIIDAHTKQPIQNAHISLISGLVLLPNKTNENGQYSFDMINSGSYRLNLISNDYRKFEIDTIYLGTGDIKELNIELYKE